MTKRSEAAHRAAEAKAKLMNGVANRVFTHKTSGLDGIAKNVVGRQAPEVPHDPELDHDFDWEFGDTP